MEIFFSMLKLGGGGGYEDLFNIPFNSSLLHSPIHTPFFKTKPIMMNCYWACLHGL